MLKQGKIPENGSIAMYMEMGWRNACQSSFCKLKFVGIKESAIVLDSLPAVVGLALRIDKPLQCNAEGARRLKSLKLAC